MINKGELSVRLIEGRDLIICDENQKSDPFVKRKKKNFKKK
jgi:Ca2+-dependent lipid-binding protein